MAWTTPGTATAGEVLTAAFWNTQVRDNMVELAPFSAAWTSYTPSLGGFSLGNGTITGRYLKVGRMVITQVKFTFGSTSSTSSYMTLGLPAAAANETEFAATVFLEDSGGARYFGTSRSGITTSDVEILIMKADATYTTLIPPTTGVPFTWSSGDVVHMKLIYQSTT